MTTFEDATSLAPDSAGQVKARGYWEQVWRRFRRDKMAVASAGFILLLVLISIGGAPLAARLLDHGPNDQFVSTAFEGFSKPKGPWSYVSTEPYPGAPGEFKDVLFVLGTANENGQDMFLRLLYGARSSLEVAVLSTIFVTALGVLMGLMAGYFRGWVDVIISRLSEMAMVFPSLLFIIAVQITVGEKLNSVTFGFLTPGVFTLVLVFTIFGWFYPARIVRGVVLSLREKEFIEAARMTGASDRRIMRSHLLPHLVAPIIVFATLAVAGFILGEAGLSFLGLGLPLGESSWGTLLAKGPTYYTVQPWVMVWPGLAILFTTIAFNLLGDGLRDAFDPRSTL